MASVFVSHSSRDRGVTEQVVSRLRVAGFAALFVDFDPEQGIPVGRSWERELYSQLRRSDAVIFLASEASVSSRWCFAELSLARSLGRPVFPVRLQPGVELPLLADVQWMELTDPEPGLARLLAELHSAGLDPADSFAWDPRRSPYPGLVPFAPEDAAVFFGRQPEIHRLVELLTPTLQRGPGRMVAVVGPSGSGKSSLLHAGLLPRLARMPERWLMVPPLRPGRRPTATLASCLARAFAVRGRPRPTAELVAALDRGSAGLIELATELVDLAGNGAGQPSVLVVIDQAEELLTRTGTHEQQAFLSLLSGALHEDSPVWAVATVRSEFLSTAPERAGLAEVIDDPLVIEPLSRSRLAEVITRPAQRAGLDLEPGLVERMVEDTAGGDALPLLGYTLHELYRRVGAGGCITEDEYEGVGGVVGALRSRADRLIGELGRRGLGQLVLPTLTRLATVTGEEPTRRRVQCSAFSAEERVVVDAFVDAFLLVSNRDPADAGGDAVVEVAHEAMLRQWPPLREAIEADRDMLRLRSELERLAADWKQGQRDDSYLLRGGRLSTIDRWATQHPEQLGSLEQEFLGANRAYATQELEATRTARRRQRRARLIAATMAVLLVVASLLGLSAKKSSDLASARELATRADQLVSTRPDLARPDLAILLGLQSMNLASGDDPIPLGLITGMAELTHRTDWLLRHDGAVLAAAFDPKGALLATAGEDGTLRLWDAATGHPQGPPLKGHIGAVTALAFSPDGTRLASGSADTTIRLWDPATGRPQGPLLEGHRRAITALAFSPDGTRLASASTDQTVRLWDPSTGQPQGPPLEGHIGAVNAVAFSPDGTRLASAGADATIRMWNPATGQQGPPLEGHTGEVTAVAFSPNGTRLASASTDRTVRLWDPATGQPQGDPLIGHASAVNAVAFSPNGTLLASAGSDRTVQLWDTATGRPHGGPLAGHDGAVNAVTFSPDGNLLASAGADGMARIWEVDETFTIRRRLAGDPGGVIGVALNPNGDLLATAGADGTVRLWNAATGQPRGELAAPAGSTDPVVDVAFSPDGAMLATAGLDGTVGLWRPDTGQLISAFPAHRGSVNDLAFSPDGSLLATAGADGTIGLWNSATGQPQREPLRGHTDAVMAVAFSPDGGLLASAGADGTVRLWNPTTGQPQRVLLTGHYSRVSAVVFSPDGRLLASAGADGTVRLWNPTTGQPRELLQGHTDAVAAVAISPNGKWLASASRDQTVRLWELNSPTPQAEVLEGRNGAVFSVAFSGDLLVTASEQAVALWDLSYWKRTPAEWTEAGCRVVNRNLSQAEWQQFASGLSYKPTCPTLPIGE